MKKALALILSLLVAFSMFAVVAAAEGEATEPAKQTITINFVYQTPGKGGEDDKVVEGKTISTVTVAPGVYVPASVVPEIVTGFKGVAADGKKYKYTFKGWRSSADDQLYYAGTIKFAEDAPAAVTMTAEYAMEDISERQSLWNLIESIFERLNLIFEYFAKVFNW